MNADWLYRLAAAAAATIVGPHATHSDAVNHPQIINNRPPTTSEKVQLAIKATTTSQQEKTRQMKIGIFENPKREKCKWSVLW